jgi:alpha-aminoadipate carrier protein LysW
VRPAKPPAHSPALQLLRRYSSKIEKEKTKMECLQCAAALDLAPDVEVGEIVICPDCGVEWEVMSIDPLTIELAPEVEEDWGE